MRKFFVLPMAILVCSLMVAPAFAIESEWITPDVGIESALYGGNRISIYGSSSKYEYTGNESQYGTLLSRQDETTGYDISSATVTDIVVDSSGYTVDVPVSVSGYAPYDHWETNYKTYEREYDYTQISFKSTAVWFFTDFYLDPGFYEIESSFLISQFLRYPSSGQNAYFRPVLFELGIENSGHHTLISRSADDSIKATIEVTERSRIYFSASTSSQLMDYNVNSAGSQWPYLRWRLLPFTFKYRAIDPIAVAALDAANTDAQNSIQQNDELEAEWVGVMNDNFNALDLSNFSWDSGLIGAFTLVSDLFMRLWAALGKYNILYVFPLTLAVVLLLIGRISRYEGKRPTGKGED